MRAAWTSRPATDRGPVPIWVVLLLMLFAAVYMDATEPVPQSSVSYESGRPTESFPGQAYYDATGWHLETDHD